MRIVVVEDQCMFREVMRKGIAALNHRVVAEAASAADGLALVAEHRPDVLLLDLSLPELDGYAVIARVRRLHPGTRIVVMSSYLNDYAVLNLDRDQIDGFIDKGTDHLSALKTALAHVAAGRKYFSPAYEALRRKRLNDSNWFAKVLSRTELKILSLAGAGRSNAEIAAELGISVRTAQTHRTNIFHKLSIHGTPKLMAFAQARGFNSTRLPA